jgi:hypothetical protein
MGNALAALDAERPDAVELREAVRSMAAGTVIRDSGPARCGVSGRTWDPLPARRPRIRAAEVSHGDRAQTPVPEVNSHA